MKKQMVFAIVLLLLIPLVVMLGGLLSSLINPEIAVGHPNYPRNYHLLILVKNMSMLASGAVAAVLWLLACFLVIRSKDRSSWWVLLAAGGPFGFAILAMLNDKAPMETDRYVRFVRGLKRFVRVGYEICIFAVIWLLAYGSMVLGRHMIIMYQSAITGMTAAQVIDLQNASSGMWAFAEGTEVMFLVVLLYLIWPLLFNLISRVAATAVSPKPS